MVVSAFTGLLTGFTALAIGVDWKKAAWLLAGTVAKDLALYLTNPTYREQVLSALPNGDTETFVKSDAPPAATLLPPNQATDNQTKSP